MIELFQLIPARIIPRLIITIVIITILMTLTNHTITVTNIDGIILIQNTVLAIGIYFIFMFLIRVCELILFLIIILLRPAHNKFPFESERLNKLENLLAILLMWHVATNLVSFTTIIGLLGLILFLMYYIFLQRSQPRIVNNANSPLD